MSLILPISWNAKVLATASASAPSSIQVWHLSDDSANRRMQELTPPLQNYMGEIVECCRLSRDGTVLVSSSRVARSDQMSIWGRGFATSQYAIRVWDPFLGTVKQTVQYGFSLYHVMSFDVSPDNQTIVAAVNIREEMDESEVITWKLE
jgi:hypothetical protein